MSVSRFIDLVVWHGFIGFAVYLFYFVASYDLMWQIPLGLLLAYFFGLYKIFSEEESQTKKFLVEVKRVD